MTGSATNSYNFYQKYNNVVCAKTCMKTRKQYFVTI